MFAAPFSERRRNRQRPVIQVEHVVGEVEPDVLSAADLASDQDHPRHVLGEPRRKLMQFADAQSSPFAWAMPHRRNLEDRTLDTLSTSFGVMENTLQEL